MAVVEMNLLAKELAMIILFTLRFEPRRCVRLAWGENDRCLFRRDVAEALMCCKGLGK